MKLTDLAATFVRIVDLKGNDYRVVDSITQAQGVEFLCPICFIKNGGPVGTHSVLCWSASRGVPVGALPGPGRWILMGSSMRDLTLHGEGGKSRSVWLKAGCGWHGFVTDGVVTDVNGKPYEVSK